MVSAKNPVLVGKIRSITYFFNFTIEIFYQIIPTFKTKNVSALVLLRQILFTGVEALTLTVFAALVIGALIIVQASAINPNFVHSQMLYSILLIIITRELATLIPALIVIARSGTAISTELGNMVINEEVEAILSFGISPISYLVVPRVFALVFSLLPLAFFFNFIGLFGAGIISFLFYDVDFMDFVLKLAVELSIKDILLTISKSVLFGLSIAIIACYNGLSVQKASTEVPQKTSRAVVESIGTIIFIDVLLALLFQI
ncbi:MAG: ABC transporter permease [Bacteroidetes bacterium]|nr:ABC transporter permease [Bacteroidota bacterium]MBU1678455.1 ABC transporter permease [Bacteroidota bacterium]MBU2505230.1 ABC transporter permease [Bacteroidota bacterium]